jgi:hypothetical protein
MHTTPNSQLESPNLRREATPILALAVLLGMLLCACAGRAPHPETVLADFVEDIRQRRADNVYQRLSEEQRGGMSRDEFASFFDQNYDEILNQADEIERAIARKQLEINAIVPGNGRHEIALSHHDGHWKLEEAIPLSAGVSNPHGTILALSKAVERQDMGTIVDMLSKDKRDTLRAELGVIRDSLSKLSEDDIVIDGNNATIYLDFGLKLELVFEDGSWRLNRLLQF